MNGLFCVLIVLCTILYGIRFLPVGHYCDNPLSLGCSKYVRGGLALLIFTHHFASLYPNDILLLPFTHIGHLVVGVFFFISGYGLQYSFNKKPGYLSYSSLMRRLIKLLIPYWVATVVCEIIESISSSAFSISHILLSFVIPVNVMGHGWYVFELLVLYVVFFFSYKRTKENRFLCMTLLTIVLTLLLELLDFGVYWYKSSFCFFVGAVFYEKKDDMIRWLRDNKYFPFAVIIECGVFIIALLAQYILFVFNSSIPFLYMLMCQTSAVFLSIIVFTLLIKVTIGNTVLAFLGSISYELYLIHPCVIMLSKRITGIDIACHFLLSLVLSVLIAWGVSKIDDRLIRSVLVIHPKRHSVQ